VLAVLGLGLVLFAAPGALMGYLMPVLEHVVGVSGPLASAVLVAYGVANVAGSFLGGRLADLDAGRALVLVTLGLALSAGALYLARAHPPLAVVALLTWAVFASSAPASVRLRRVRTAGRDPHRDAGRPRCPGAGRHDPTARTRPMVPG
jgi:DHA1 family inner membrane transport protein